MDTRKWKKILLHWITECGFVERNYFNIEQSDIDAFFHNYCHHLRYDGVSVASARGSADLAAFLQEQYPDFEPHFDDNYSLSSSDYIYVYSLLLHFSCVKYPEEYFHDICQKLSEQAQQNIAAFFNLLLDCPAITKETLRHAIANVTQSSPRSNESFNSGLASPSFSHSDSLIKTPKRPAAQRVSPSTPKTFLLEERTRELYNLRALLETERYEKGLLEVQIKQNEDKILKLNQDHKKLQQQIQDLKNDILTKNTENSSSPKRDGDEQIKRRLCKEISQKEQEISKLTDILSTLREEKSLLQEKLSYAEKQIVVCMERIKELDYRVDELSAELEQKNSTIKYLTDNKLELEQFISETRSASNNTRPDLNMSIDCIDTSFSRTTNSSGSQSSPENLGCSVIDVQLREKEIENQQLREALTNVRVGNNKLAKHMQQIAQKHADEWQLNIENVTVNENEFVDPAEHFVIFANCVDKLSKRYKNEQNMVQKLQQDALAMQQHNTRLSQRVQQFEADVNEMKTCIQSVEVINQDLEKANNELKERLRQYEQEVDALNKQKLEMISKLEGLANEYEAHKVSCETSQKEFTGQLTSLQADLLGKHKEFEALQASNNQLQVANAELQSNLNALEEKFTTKSAEYETEIKSLNERLENKAEQLGAHASAEVLVKDKYEKLLIHSEDLKRSAREADQHLDVMRNELVVKEMEMNKLGTEIVEVRTKNCELEERINALMNKHRNEMQTSDMAINKKEALLQEVTSEKDKIKAQLEEAHRTHEQNRLEYAKVNKNLQDTADKVAKLLTLLKSLEDTDDEEEIENSNVVDDIVRKVKQLVHQKNENSNKIECLEFDNIEYKAQLRAMDHNLQKAMWEKEQLISQHEENLLECKTELTAADERIKQYQKQLDILKNQQTAFIENLEKQLQGHLAEKSELTQLQQLQQLEQERKAENEDHVRLERELILVIGQHNVIKCKLLETETEISHLKEEKSRMKKEHDHKVQQFDEKLQAVERENGQLMTDIKNFKKEHVRIEHMLRQANSALEELSGQLTAEAASKSQLDLKLQDRTVRLLETEKKLHSIMEEKNTYQDQADNYKRATDQIKMLNQAKNAQASKIEEQKQKLKKVTEEKENLQKTYSNVCKQMEREQSEKAVLLRSLEKTADQLKVAVDEKARQTSVLEQRCAELQSKYTESSELNKQLQSDLVSKEAEWTLQLDEIENERAEMQSKLMRKLAEQAEQIETYDVVLIEIVTELETQIQQCASSSSNSAAPYVFNVEETNEDTPHYSQLKQALNKFLVKVSQLQEQVDEAEQKRKEAADYVEVLTKANGKLNTQLTRNKAEIAELQEILAGETQSVNTKLTNEVQRLNEDIHNVECVNVKVAGENAALQQKLAGYEDELASSKVTINMLTEEQKKLKQEKIETERKILDFQSKYDGEINVKAAKICTLEEELQESNEAVAKLKKHLHKLQIQTSSNNNETRELNEKVRTLQDENGTLESTLNKKNREFIALQDKFEDAKNARTALEEQIRLANKRLDAAIQNRLENESKCNELHSKMQQLQRDFTFAQTQLISAQAEHDKLSNEIETIRRDKEAVNNDLKEVKRELQRAMDNVTELIQQIASIRLEKEALVEENQLLRKQLEESGKYQSNSESKIKSIFERSQSLELSLLTAENELKSIKAHLEKSELNADKLLQDNKKLRDSHEASTKRIEKLALKLGDAQARGAKLERENEKVTKTIEATNNSLETLQREKDALQSENKSLKERLSRAERTQEQMSAKVQTLEQSHIALEAAKTKLEATEIDVKSKLLKLEKMRETNEEKIRKLNHALNSSEQSNVRLNLEIGALNSQLNEERRSVSEERLEQTEQAEDIKKKLAQAEEQAQHYEQLCTQLEDQAEKLRAENTHVSDQLSKVSLSLQITKEKCDTLANEMEQLRTDIEELRAAKHRLDAENNATVSKMKQQDERQHILLAEQKALVAELEAAVAKLQDELTSKTTQLVDVESEVLRLRERVTEQETSEDILATHSAEMENIRTRLAVAEALLEKEQTSSAQLRADNQILQAKYKEAKQRIIEETKASEERIKENRLELEGKLEKMKNKMKTLYTEEITKMKVKQERETASLKTELDVLKAQNIKYEEHTRKLSSQMVRLNDNILEHQKQNAILTTKLKHLEDHYDFKRPSSIHVSSTMSASVPSSKNFGTNLAMEDEEGEVFNNTYLTDLKTGCMSELMSREVCTEELQYRNSLLPPHLQSTYAAQYDHGLTEDDLKDGGGPHSMDDSMSALLSTTVGGTRKKISGATSYKRPGPPTPSKNGGRLSFGGISEPGREILKESCDGNAAAVSSSSKTPARFKIFSSRFSMGNNTKDEPLRLDLRKAVHKKNFQLIRMAGAGAVCTSTPRKSKSHFDQRRLLDQMLKSSPSPSTTSPVATPHQRIFKTPPLFSISRNQNMFTSEALKKRSKQKGARQRSHRSSFFKQQRSCSRKIHAAGDAAVVSCDCTSPHPLQLLRCTPTTTSSDCCSVTVLQRRMRRRSKRERGTRPSLYLRGNIFAKYRTPTRGGAIYRDLFRHKARRQRMDNFNRFRILKAVKQEAVDDEDGEDRQNNNYANVNHNRLGETVVIIKKKPLLVLDNVVQADDDFVEDEGADEDGFEIEEFDSDSTDKENTPIVDFSNYEEATKNSETIDKNKLVTTLDLIEFDKRNCFQQIDCDQTTSSTNSKYFENLLGETESQAPFEVKRLQFESTAASSLATTGSVSNVAVASQNTISSSGAYHSRTIYGGSVIYNRKIPNVNTTFVRKSSIYIKHRDATDGGIILVTDQTITLLDLLRMWKQMDSSTRLILAIILLVSFIALVGIFITFFWKQS